MVYSIDDMCYNCINTIKGVYEMIEMKMGDVRCRAREIPALVGLGEVIKVEHGKSHDEVGFIVGHAEVDAEKLESGTIEDALMRDVFHRLGALRRHVEAGRAVRVKDGNAARNKEHAEEAVLFWFLPVSIWMEIQENNLNYARID